MRSPLVHSVIAFLLTTTLFWCFYEVVLKESQQRSREEVLAVEKYQALQRYVDENDLDYDKVRRVCYGRDPSRDTFLMNYAVMFFVCGMIIVPYSILLKLIRRFADRLPDFAPESGQDQTA